MMAAKQFGFRKRERLVSQRLIDDLFAGGHSRSVAAFPLRAVYQLRPRGDHDVPVQMLVSVPKKHFHHAVDRNRVKRQVREAWRHQQPLLAQSLGADRQLLVAFVWQSNAQLTTQQVASRVAGIVRRIQEKL